MGISLHLAMTAAEISASDALPTKLAYMACHFSPYGAGLSNIPECLPPGSVLILNDRTPIRGHDHKLIKYQLSQAMEQLQCSSLLLDFQRPDNSETKALCQSLLEDIGCTTAVSSLYAVGLNCPVFLPPCPLDQPLADYLDLWKNRPIWLEIARDALQVTVDKDKSHYNTLQVLSATELPHFASDLLCHYRIDTTNSSAVFTLSRTEEDTTVLIQKAETLGVLQCIGLWQELGK